MPDQIIAALLTVGALTGSAVITCILVGSAIYDIQAAKLKRYLTKHPYAKSNRARPLLTAVITSSNAEATIINCLDHLFSSTYKNIEAIVIDQASTDNTKQLVKQYIRNYPNRPIKLMAKRKKYVDHKILESAYRKLSSGELVMVLGADSMLEKNAIKLGVIYLNNNDGVNKINLRLCIDSSWSVTGLYQQYISFLEQRILKFASIINSLRINEEGCIYRKEYFMGANRRSIRNSLAAEQILPNAKYINNARIFVNRQYIYPVTFKLLHRKNLILWRRGNRGINYLSWLAIIYFISSSAFTVILPVLIGYFFYLAFWLHEPTMFVVCVILLGLLLVSAIWDEEEMSLLKKISYVIGLPIVVGLLLLGAVYGALNLVGSVLYFLFVNIFLFLKLNRQSGPDALN
jgi:glycosyltransferase involved in cell wall biosynthesis